MGPNAEDAKAKFDLANNGGVEPAHAEATVGKNKKYSWKRRLGTLTLIVLSLYIVVGIYQSSMKPLPASLSIEGNVWHVPEHEIEFLYDVTALQGRKRISEQMIFDRALELIQGAEDFLLLDCFLFNEYLGKDPAVHRKLCGEITTALLERKRSCPGIHIVVVSDPVNEAYGGPVPRHFKELQTAGIPVILTDLRKLRDSNVIYSGFWRLFVQWFGTSRSGWLPHPFSKEAGHVSARSWMSLLNFKANHRKLIIADAASAKGGREIASLVISANPHDASSAHNNVAVQVRGEVWMDLLRGEQAVLDLSGADIILASRLPAYATVEAKSPAGPLQPNEVSVQVLSEGKICKAILEAIGSANHGDRIDLAMFYLAERGIVQALLAAAKREVAIRVLLDPNRDAFGYQKNGIPNRPVAAELMASGAGRIVVRWFNTHGEQFHTKMLLFQQAGTTTLFTGSANLTRRNIGDFNLETDVVVKGSSKSSVFQSAQGYFDRLWNNQMLEFSLPYEAFAEPSRLKYWQYRFQERSGLSTF